MSSELTDTERRQEILSRSARSIAAECRNLADLASARRFGGGASQDMRRRTGQPKVIADVDSADLSGVSGTPTFFINGKRHYGAYDIDTLSAAVRAARARVLISSPNRRQQRTS